MLVSAYFIVRKTMPFVECINLKNPENLPERLLCQKDSYGGKVKITAKEEISPIYILLFLINILHGYRNIELWKRNNFLCFCIGNHIPFSFIIFKITEDKIFFPVLPIDNNPMFLFSGIV
jgi:hypothetical protein